MMEEFFAALSRIGSKKQGQLWEEAAGALNDEVRRLTGHSVDALVRMSPAELFAALIRGESTLAVREKCGMVTRLFKEAGDIAAAQGRVSEGQSYYIKGLQLVLDALATGPEAEFYEFVPRVEAFLVALEDAPLDRETQARLMQHFERSGQYAKAEDRLYEILGTGPLETAVLDFGIAFYERLQVQSDRKLAEGNLPRSEIEAALADLRQKRNAPHP